jgi:hypothetical protein
MEEHLGTSHNEAKPWDGQLVDETTSTTIAGRCIHQVRLRKKSDDTPLKDASKEKPTL